jgi:hypothetical protein
MIDRHRIFPEGKDHIYPGTGTGIISEYREAGRIEGIRMEIKRADPESCGESRHMNDIENDEVFLQRYQENTFERFSGKVVRTWVR